MNAIKQTHRSQEGSVLLGVACFLFLATGLVATILVLGSNHRKVSLEQVTMEQAMYVAEGGLERGAAFMAVPSNLVAITSSQTGITNGSGSLGAGTYAFVITRSTNATTYNLVSTGTVNNVTRTVSLQRIYQPSYAEFAMWTSNSMGLFFKNGEVFNGRVHSNDQMYFDVSGGDGAWFKQAVTSGAGTYTVQGGSFSLVEFDQGFLLNTLEGSMADVNFNDSSKPKCLKDTATSGGLVLQGNTTITFNGGSVSISNTRQNWANHTYTPATEGIIYIQNSNTGSASTQAGTAFLTRGTVNGRLTIATESDITIRGNITYASNPTSNPSSDDALGLIASSDVWVDTSAPNNLVVYAAIMATGISSTVGDGSFGVVNYNDASNPHLGNRGTLTVYGGIVQLIRGAVGTFNSQTGVMSTGYAKNYSYDLRFINNPPPYYPVISDQVRFSQWREGR
jgi:hypothetical protein